MTSRTVESQGRELDMSEAELKVKLFGKRGSAEAYAIRDFLTDATYRLNGLS